MSAEPTKGPLPDAAALQRLCRALAVLDAINSPDWEYRYYSYNAAWGPDKEALTMRDGEGDEMLVLFRPEGCVVNGFLHETEQPDKEQATQGIPACFREFIFGEPVQSIGTTFCRWYTPARGWQTGTAPEAEDADNLLYIFDGQPETYAQWADEYYGDETERQPLDPAAVAKIYKGEMLTKFLVLSLVEEPESWPQLEAELREIGYPYDFS